MIRLRLLGGVSWDGQPVTGDRQQRLLVALAEAGHGGASVARLVEEIWGDEAPADPARALQVVVSRTRTITGPEAVERTDAGYRLGLADDDVDLLRLRTLLDRARTAARAEQWPETLAAAEAAGFAQDTTGDGPLAAEGARLAGELRRLRGLARARLGQHEPALPDLEAAVATAPDDETVLVALLRALAATRSPASALERYEHYRSDLADRLGTDPGPELQRLHGELLAADRPVRSGVRYDATPLVGRDEDVARLQAMLASGRVTSIVGAGGLGKTRLAHVLAREASQPVVHVVELAGITSPEDVVSEVGSVLGVRDSVSGRRTLTPRQRADVRARMITQLELAPTLLVLDNCEHLIDAVAELVGVLIAGARDLRVLTTSRAPLGISAERVYLLGQLGLDDAVNLFCQRALAARPTVRLERDEVAGLVARLDGLPLAVELAAARVRAMSVEEITRRLDDRFALLRGGDRSAPDRHRTLLAVIDWSWALLTEPQRAAARRLAVFHDGFALDAVEAVLTEEPDPLGVVEELVEQSLVGIQESDGHLRYRMLETVREFGRVKLAESGEEAATQAIQRDWAAALADRAWVDLYGPQQYDVVEALHREEGNLADVLRRAIEEQDRVTVVRLMSALADFWSIRGDHSRVVSLTGAVEQVVAGWTPPEDLADQTRTVLSAIVTNGGIFRGIPAAESRRALAALGEPVDARLRGVVTVLLGTAPDGVLQGGAGEDIEAHLATLRQHPEREVRMVALQWAGHQQENTGDPAAAIESAREALALWQESDGPWTRGILTAQLAEMEMQLGHPVEAAEHARQALPILTRLRADDDAIQLRALLAHCALLDGRIDEAEQILDAIELLDTAPVFGTRVVLPAGRAEVALARGEIERGLALFRDAMNQLTGMRIPGLEATGLEPWALFGAAAALTAYAIHGGGEGGDLYDKVRDGARRYIGGESGHLDYPVAGMLLFSLAAWGAHRETLPLVTCARLAALAEGFGYNRTFPVMAWRHVADAVDALQPGLLAAEARTYAGRRGPALHEDATRVLAEL